VELINSNSEAVSERVSTLHRGIEPAGHECTQAVATTDIVVRDCDELPTRQHYSLLAFRLSCLSGFGMYWFACELCGVAREYADMQPKVTGRL